MPRKDPYHILSTIPTRKRSPPSNPSDVRTQRDNPGRDLREHHPGFMRKLQEHRRCESCQRPNRFQQTFESGTLRRIQGEYLVRGDIKRVPRSFLRDSHDDR